MNRDDIDRLVDDTVVLNAFYHGSYDPLPVGETLQARTTSRKDSALERFVNLYRPEGAAPRWKAWYMTEDPCEVERAGGNPRHIYEVESTSAAQPANFRHVEDLWSEWFRIARESGLTPTIDDFNTKANAESARRYWANAPSSEGHQTEWLAPEIRVVREVKCKGGQAGRKSKRRRTRKWSGPSRGSKELEARAKRRPR